MTDRPVDVLVDSPLEIVAAGLSRMLEEVADRVRIRVRGATVRGLRPDVVIYDSLWLHRGGEAGLRQLLTASATPVPVLVLVHELRPDLAGRALTLGAQASLPLEASRADLLESVEAVAGRRIGVVTAGQSRVLPPIRLGADAGLTVREVEVLTLIAQGHSNQAIADLTYLSINSVKTFVRSAYRRIGVRNRSQAVVWAIEHGFPTRPQPS